MQGAQALHDIIRITTVDRLILTLVSISILLRSKLINIRIHRESALLWRPAEFSVSNAALSALFDPMVTLRNPFRGLPGLDAVVVQFIDLFEGQSLGFGNAEPGENETAHTSRSPDEEDLDTETSVTGTSLDEVGRGVGNSPVPKPVGGGVHGHRFGTNSQRVQLASDDPGNGAPGSSEEEDVDTDEGDQ